MSNDLLILKAVLLLRTFNQSDTKDDQITMASKVFHDDPDGLLEWIRWLKKEIEKTSEQRYAEYSEPEIMPNEIEEHNCYTSCTAGDYSPSCPWNAPGMSISDFI